VELENWSRYRQGNILLFVGGCLLSKLDLMVLLIASKLVLWLKVILKFLGWIFHMAKMTSVRLFIVMTALQQWSLYQLDVKNAFLNGDLQEIYIVTSWVCCSRGVF